MKSSLIRKIVGGISLTSVMFVFQACYGTPQDFEPDLLIEGQVKSKTSGLPVKGIKVTIADHNQYEFTNDEGKFSIYTAMFDSITLQFRDVDSTQNGHFTGKDTLLRGIRDKVYLDIALEEK